MKAEVTAALETLKTALAVEAKPLDVALADIIARLARIEEKLDKPLAQMTVAAPVETPKPVVVAPSTPAPVETPKPAKARKLKADPAPEAKSAPVETPKPEEAKPAAPEGPKCMDCGMALHAENSSISPSTGKITHIGCPKGPQEEEVLNLRKLQVDGPAPAKAPEAPKTGPTFEDLRQAALSLVQTHGKPALLKILEAHGGAKKISDLAEDAHQPVLDEIKAASAAPVTAPEV